MLATRRQLLSFRWRDALQKGFLRRAAGSRSAAWKRTRICKMCTPPLQLVIPHRQRKTISAQDVIGRPLLPSDPQPVTATRSITPWWHVTERLIKWCCSGRDLERMEAHYRSIMMLYRRRLVH